MNITLEPGRYIVAVSGGVDSVALLHALQSQPGLKLVVAHFDHGIRPESRDDQVFVRRLARQYRLPYVYTEGRLGADASEAAARQARYEFLHKTRMAAGAQAVVTAHHQDDVLETAILNIVRGTGRRGLTSLKSTDIVRRPLLHVPKAHIIRYARDNQLLWQEDSTNASDAYKRNHVRHNVLSRFSPEDRQALYDIIVGMRRTNDELDEELAKLLEGQTTTVRSKSGKHQPVLDRRQFVMLPHAVAREIMASWLRSSGVSDIDKKMLERLVHASKTHSTGQRASINRNWTLLVGKLHLALERTER